MYGQLVLQCNADEILGAKSATSLWREMCDVSRHRSLQ